MLYCRPGVGMASEQGLLSHGPGSPVCMHVSTCAGGGNSLVAYCLRSYQAAVRTQAAGENNANLAIYGLAFLLTTLGIVYVQEAERKIPMNYANRYRAGALSPQSYLPFKASTPSRCLSSLLLTTLLHV